MATIHKAEIYFVDYNDNYDSINSIIADIENSTDLMVKVFDIGSKDIEWHDNIDLNFTDCSVENYRNYFK